MWSHFKAAAGGVLILGFALTPALAASDAAAGKALAERWCASCHLVSEEQKSTTTEAPPFATVAKRAPKDNAALAAFLAGPHPPMPPISLSRREIDQLLDYITSLR
jgi:mono/diheme cytochrome c family protein